MKLSNNIEVGYCSLFQITPTSVKWIYRAFGLFTLLWITLLGFYSNQIPVNVQLDVFKALSCGTALTYAGAQFFGITLPQNPSELPSQSPTSKQQVVIPTSPLIIKPNE